MQYFHCSPTGDLKILLPREPKVFDKPRSVYMTTRLPMALMYGVRNFEYSYGYTKDGQIYYEEYFPNALEVIYRGKSASLYLCAPQDIRATQIPNEVRSESAVNIIRERKIPDVCEALLEQERMGMLVIRRYHELPQRTLDWICRAEADTIRKKNLLREGGQMAAYYQEHYPKSWAIVEAEQKRGVMGEF